MAIEYIWLFLEESTTGRRERGRNCTKTVYNKSTAIFATNFSKILMAPSDGMAIFGRSGCCQIKLAGIKFNLNSSKLAVSLVVGHISLAKCEYFVRIIMILSNIQWTWAKLKENWRKMCIPVLKSALKILISCSITVIYIINQARYVSGGPCL